MLVLAAVLEVLSCCCSLLCCFRLSSLLRSTVEGVESGLPLIVPERFLAAGVYILNKSSK